MGNCQFKSENEQDSIKSKYITRNYLFSLTPPFGKKNIIYTHLYP